MSRSSVDTRPGSSPKNPGYAGNSGDKFAGRRPTVKPWEPHPAVANDAESFGHQPENSGGTDPRAGV